MRYRLVALVLLFASLFAQAESCTISRAKAVNKDGSSLVLKESNCPDQDQRISKIYYQAGAGLPKRLVLKLHDFISDAPSGGIGFMDLDKDGFYEVSESGMCGAGPNCEGSIYKLAADRRSMFTYFSGGYADLSLIGGYLVEGGRASCCAWEFHLYKSQAKHYPINYDHMVYRVVVSLDAEGEKPKCTFYRQTGNTERIARPPNKSLLQLCENYGPDYTLVHPQKRH